MMAKNLTLLFSSAGRRNQLMQCFRESAAALGATARVLAADFNPRLSPACPAADAAFTVPGCAEPDFAESMLAICRRERVDVLIPTIDPELAVYSARREDFAVAGTRVVISAPEVVALAGDKRATAERLRAAGIATPATVTLEHLRGEPAALRWPVIVKPNNGSASAGIHRLQSPAELGRLRGGPEDIAQELWQGREYTVNLFFSADGRLRCAVPHWRIETRSGEVSKGVTVRLDCLLEAARKLESCLPGARGPLCFQAMVTEAGDMAVFELNARFGGGYPLAHRAGAPFAQWILEEILGRECSAHDGWREGVTMLRYDAAVFVDGGP